MLCVMNGEDFNYPVSKRVSLLNLTGNISIFSGLLCFSIALFLPALYTSSEDIVGFWILATGWMGLVVLQFAWFANPVTLLSLLLAHKNPRIALLLGGLALTLACCAFYFHEIPTGINYEKIYIREFGLGFYLWITSHALVLIGLFFGFLHSLKRI